MTKNLLHDHESIIKTLREDIVKCDEMADKPFFVGEWFEDIHNLHILS